MSEPNTPSDPGTIDFFGASAPSTLPVPSTPPPAAEPEPEATVPVAVPVPLEERPVRRGIRVRTLVFGVVLLVISGASLLALLTKVKVEAGAVGLVLLVGAGAGLLVGGLSAAVSDLRRGGSRTT